MPSRNRIVVLLLMPIAVFLWCLGWSFYCVGSGKQAATPRIRAANELTLGLLLPENKIEA